MNDRKKAFYKLVRASSLKEGDLIYIRLKEEEIPDKYFHIAKWPGAEEIRLKFLKNPTRNCDIRVIRHFGSKIMLQVRCRRNAAPGDGYLNFTRLVDAQSWQAVFIGWHEGRLP